MAQQVEMIFLSMKNVINIFHESKEFLKRSKYRRPLSHIIPICHGRSDNIPLVFFFLSLISACVLIF